MCFSQFKQSFDDELKKSLVVYLHSQTSDSLIQLPLLWVQAAAVVTN